MEDSHYNSNHSNYDFLAWPERVSAAVNTPFFEFFKLPNVGTVIEIDHCYFCTDVVSMKEDLYFYKAKSSDQHFGKLAIKFIAVCVFFVQIVND